MRRPRDPVHRRRVAAGAGVLALVAFGAGLVASLGGDDGRETADRFARAYERGDLTAMRELVDASSRERGPTAFARAYEDARRVATLERVRVGPPGDVRDDVVEVPAVASTRAFGTVRAPLRLELVQEGDAWRVRWGEHLTFPGVRAGERLEAQLRLPPRGELRWRDGESLARGDGEATDPLASSIVGELGDVPDERRDELRAQGVPSDAQVGLTGLERVLDAQLRGRPGGTLSAGGRTLGRAAPRAAAPVRTSLSARIQEAAVTALGGRLGGVAVQDPRTGELLALAGFAFSGLQPPGSVFKVVTLAAALDAGVTRPTEVFPVETFTTLDGVRLENANGEACGGTLVASFAESCNSVFAPLGVEVGARRLAQEAERFGFNEAPGIPGAKTPVMPAADDVQGDLALGSTAIGQGTVQATALSMSSVAAAIAAEGRRPRPVLRLGERTSRVRATSERVARQVERAMLAVVREGTGTAAAVPGVPVAGKTGTAELRSTATTDPEADPNDQTDTTAWFTAFAPAGPGRTPRVAMAIVFPGAGSGGATAAPAAKGVLEAALRATD